MKSKEIIEVVSILVGEINPIGETNIDKDRLDNLEKMASLINYLILKIYAVSNNKDRPEASMKKAGQNAQKFLASLKDFVE